MRRARALATLVATLVVATGVPLVGAGPAHAAAFRYWTYWHGDSGAWAFSGIGADSWRLKDGAVEGWRFAVSPGTAAAPPPRPSPASVWQLEGCRDKVAGEGEVRAAVVIDFGDAGDYADGQRPPSDPVRVFCDVFPARSTGMALLNRAADGALRIDGGMVCGISGFPARGCGELVADPKPTRSTAPPTTAEPTRPARPAKTPPATPSPSPSGPLTTSPGQTSSPGAGAGSPTTAATGPSPGGSSAAPGAGAPSTGATPLDASTAVDAASGDAGSPTPVVGLPVAAEAASTGTPWPAVLVAMLLAALAGGTYWRRRHR